ncbi:beta-ketoacyl synthase N-terminal-like domain-containing protein [Roseicella sp. DB1501]|uniref:beta-ketoacyl synthase N-terminal-like domain-containing protein n=1 Tax=Roseicella sp. DB1501 TaxID=2730925 RepID=UPI0014908EC9|nr:beta-ketoacyl synthase N-terminal-like domain-containing protein [Roseicella sp. DB1501]NOG69159.1 beta-ketoacyl-ACP synthase [Roseicella sp. DB1501]
MTETAPPPASLRDHRGRHRVAVTGIGLVTPLGLGVAESWAALLAGRSGIRRITRFPTAHLKTTIAGQVTLPEGATGEVLTSPARVERMAGLAAAEAIAAAGLAGEERFPGPLCLGMPPVEVEWPHRIALARQALDREPGPLRYPALAAAATGQEALFEQCLFGGVGERLAARFGTTGAPVEITTACATGASAIQLGVEAIQRGEAPAALCIGAEGSVQPEALIRFSLLSALSTRNEEPERASRPFEKNREGFVMSEGAAALVLESLEGAMARGATVLGLVLGCGERADSFHRTRSNPDGGAIIGAMRAAIADAGLEPAAIDYVNAHGTGTPENDKMETLGMRAVFGEACPPISSNKSMIGHTLSAAGAIEAVFSLLAIRDGMLPPTINHETPDPAIPLDVVPNEARPAAVRHVLSNSFGFGGQNVCLVLGAAPQA